jgi:DNA-binding LacI/PurR family transcriptional regulator
MMLPGRRPTSADVARRAGVSRATVSYVLNNSPHQSIPDATRQRVLAAAEELDYTPHVAARALRAGESRLVLFINTGIPYGTNLAILIDTLASEVAASGRSLVLWQQHDPRDLAATLAHLEPAFAITLGQLDDDQRALLARARILNVATDVGGDAHQVDRGAALQIRHLATRGHRQVGYLTTTDPLLTMFAGPRLAGVLATCAELGLDPPPVAELPALSNISIDDLAPVLHDWTGRPDPVTAVACYNDVCAAACLAAADRVGLNVPGDLAVIGLDDEPMSAFIRPALTTIRPHVIDFARQLWTRAKAAMDGGPVLDGPSSMHFSLVERESA